MQAGNARYTTPEDLPNVIPVFPLSGALLLPGAQLPLNIFEPRYLSLFDDALAGKRLIGIIQPALETLSGSQQSKELCKVGCIGRITSIAETGDGRYIASLTGVCRFRVIEELSVMTPYRQCKITPFASDLSGEDDEASVDRKALLGAFKAYLDANTLEADWESVEKAGNATLVNSMSMMSPYGPAEKQALLEAPDLKARAETLVAITEFVLARDFGDSDMVLN